jgi:hypothetical protein
MLHKISAKPVTSSIENVYEIHFSVRGDSMTSYESGQQSLCMRAMVEYHQQSLCMRAMVEYHQQTAFTARHRRPGLSVSESGSLR